MLGAPTGSPYAWRVKPHAKTKMLPSVQRRKRASFPGPSAILPADIAPAEASGHGQGRDFLLNGQSSSGSAAIVLVTDQNYALPTFSAALSADQHTKGADIAIRMFVSVLKIHGPANLTKRWLAPRLKSLQ